MRVKRDTPRFNTTGEQGIIKTMGMQERLLLFKVKNKNHIEINKKEQWVKERKRGKDQ